MVGQALVIPDPPGMGAGAGGQRTVSEERLAPLHPGLARRGRALLTACAQAGFEIMVTQGLRTWAAQDALYAKGRTVPPLGRRYRVTNARGGQSFHNFGLAFDIVVIDAVRNGRWDDGHPGWAAAGRIGKGLGFRPHGFGSRPIFSWPVVQVSIERLWRSLPQGIGGRANGLLPSWS